MKRLGFRGTLVYLCVSSNSISVASMCFLMAKSTIPKLLVAAKDQNGVATISSID